MEKRSEGFEEYDPLSTWALRGLFSARGIIGWASLLPVPGPPAMGPFVSQRCTVRGRRSSLGTNMPHPSQGGSRTHVGLNPGSATQQLFDLLGPPLLHL